MRKIFGGLAILILAVIALPPLVYSVFPAEAFELPEAGQRISVGADTAVNAVVRGEGPAMVLIHGLPGTGYDWAPLTEALAERGHRVYAYDRVGYGHSDPRADEEFTVDANARDLLGLLESQDLHDVTLVGWSYGGPIAIRAATFDDSRIARLALIGSGGPSDTNEEPPAIFALIFSSPVLSWLTAVPPVARGLREAISTQAFSDGPMPEWWLPQLHANLDQSKTIWTYREEGARVTEGELDPSQVDRPTLLIHGDDDRLAPLGIAKWLHKHAPGSVLDVVEGGSHMLPITHTTRLAERIAAFAASP